MAVPDREAVTGADDASEHVSAHRTSPDRTVFTEDGNADAWISTDVTVSVTE
ncbi:hypothetical protein [Halorarum halobium]|uniref:hypothetical protein n=1 Tax=Halorarum halobium TaxID=3075121 RepID=UPI0028A6F524|nr:hypothetical protein [Halobaculum sp. XH14]